MKNMIIGLLAGLIIGLWFGVNIGRDKPIWSNPFNEPSLGDRAKDAYQDTKRAIKEGLNGQP